MRFEKYFADRESKMKSAVTLFLILLFVFAVTFFLWSTLKYNKLMNEKSEDTAADGSVNSPEGYTFAQDGSMVPEFEAAAFALGENAISDIVEVESAGYKGFHILKRVPTSVSGIASVLSETDEVKAERENAIKDVKIEVKEKISFFDALYK